MTELYKWTVGSDVITETNAMFAKSFAGLTYTPASLERTAIEHSDSMDKGGLSVTVVRDHEVATRFRAQPPDTATLEIFQAKDGSYVRIWSGRLISVTWQGSKATVAVEAPTTAARLRGLRGMFQVTCRHRLFDGRCLAQAAVGAALSDYFQTVTIEEITGSRVLVTGLTTAATSDAGGSTYFLSGELVFGSSRRMIVGYEVVNLSDAWVTLHTPIVDLTVGESVELRTGCDHTIETCESKFKNDARFGGFPYAPPANPFDPGVL